MNNFLPPRESKVAGLQRLQARGRDALAGSIPCCGNWSSIKYIYARAFFASSLPFLRFAFSSFVRRMEEGSEASGFKTPASSAGGGAAAEDASASKPKAR